MAVARHIPLRTCVACRSTAPKRGLVRVVRTPQGGVEVDTTGKKAGRGAYVCVSEACVRAAFKNKRLERSLKVVVPTEIEQQLLELCAQRQQQEVTRE